jgi:hypothetical protein
MQTMPMKMLVNAIEAWKAMQDDQDLVHSFERIHKRNNP